MFVGMYCCNSNFLANLGNYYVHVSEHYVAEKKARVVPVYKDDDREECSN